MGSCVAFTGTVGGVFGPVLSDVVLDITRSYHLIFLVLVGLASISFMLTLPVRPGTSNKAMP